MECSASDKTPRLPVTAARKTFSDTSTTAEPTEPSAAIRFSRLACSIVVEAIRGIIRCGVLLPGDVVYVAAATPALERQRQQLPRRAGCDGQGLRRQAWMALLVSRISEVTSVQYCDDGSDLISCSSQARCSVKAGIKVALGFCMAADTR